MFYSLVYIESVFMFFDTVHECACACMPAQLHLVDNGKKAVDLVTRSRIPLLHSGSGTTPEQDPDAAFKDGTFDIVLMDIQVTISFSLTRTRCSSSPAHNNPNNPMYRCQ